jgi:hypothetical protein
MKTTTVLFLVFLAMVCFGSESSADTNQIVLSDLGAPSSPAFSLLGVAPTVVDRPSNPKIFALDVLESAKNGSFPQNYAMEFAPYWLFNHAYDMESDTSASHWAWGVVGATSVSIATMDLSNTAAVGVTGTTLGLGIRTTILPGNLNKSAQGLVQKITDLQSKIAHLDDKAADSASAQKSYEDQIKTTVTALEVARQYRTGWLMQVAGALAIDFPQGASDQGNLHKDDVWLTTTYRFEDPLIDFINVVRYVRDETDSTQNAADVGARFLFQKNEIGLSAEYLERWFSGGSTYRFDGEAEYEWSKDLYFTASIGRNFGQAGGVAGDLFSLVGVKFGMSPTALAPN